MKRQTMLALLFIVVFAIAYLILCFMVPGFRIKLEAEPLEYFIESLKSMILIKALVSLACSTIAIILASFAVGKK